MAAQADDLPPDAAAGSYRPKMPPFRAVTAAGKRIELSTRVPGQKILRDPAKWQEDIWTFYDAVPEVKFIGRFYGNALSRIRLVPSVIVDSDEAPVPVDDAVKSETDGGIGLPEQIATLANEVTERLSSGSDGLAGIMRGFGENLGLVGDCYLVGRDATEDDDVVGDEVWQVYSTSAVREDSDGSIIVKETPSDRGKPLDGDPSLYRIWRRHARWPGLADANMKACLDECEELLIYSRMLRAIGRSGTSAGLLLVPLELDEVPANQRMAPGTPPTTDTADGTPVTEWTPLERTIMEQFINPSEMDGSAAAVAAALIRGKAEHLKEMRHLVVERAIDDKVIERIEFLIRRMGHGADLPVEVLTGVADANHWTGWQIEDSTYKAHVEPTAQIPAAALTACYLRPLLAVQGVDQQWLRRLVYGLDPSALVVRPNRAPDARELHKAWAVSDAYLRDAHGVPESAAPDDEELQRRYVLNRGIGGQDLTAVLMNKTITEDEPIPTPSEIAADAEAEGEGTQPPADGDTPGEDGGEPTPDQPAARLAPVVPITAASTAGALGGQLAAIERRLRERLQTAASSELEAALRRAGNRLRGAVQGQPEADQVNGQPAELVGLLIGADRAAELVDVDQLLAGSFDNLRDRWDAWLGSAEAEAAALVNEVAGDGGASVEATDAGDAERGWRALAGGLVALAGRRLFAAMDADPGELDAHSSVPAGVIRDALAVAGGGSPSVAPIGTAAQSGPASLLSGPRWTRQLAALDIEREAWQWQAGFPTTPFEPHQRLSGALFDTWGDPVLSNGGAWPRTAFYYPGDHLGCQCDAIPVLVVRS